MRKRWFILLGIVIFVCSFSCFALQRMMDYVFNSDCYDAVQKASHPPRVDISTIHGFQKLQNLQRITIANASQVSQLEQAGRGYVRDAFWAKDGRLLVLTSIGLWQQQQVGPAFSEPQLLQTLPIGTNTFLRSPDNSLLAISDYGFPIPLSILIMNIFTGRRLASIKVNSGILEHETFSPDGTKLAGNISAPVLAWDVATGTTIATIGTFTYDTYQIAFSPDSELVAVSGGIQLYGEHDDPTSIKKVVRVWSFRDKALRLDTEADGSVSLAFNQDGSQLLVRGATSLSIQQIGKTLSTTPVSPTSTPPPIDTALLNPYFSQWTVTNLSFDLEGRPQGHLSTPSSVSLWPSPVLTPNQAAVFYVANGESANERVVKECEVSTAKEQRTLDYYYADSLAFSPNNSVLAINDGYGHVGLLDAKTYQKLATLAANDSTDYEPSSSIAFSPDSSLLAFGAKEPDTGDFDIQIWDVKARKRLTVLQGHTATTVALVFNSDSTLLASSSVDGTVRLWGIVETQ